MEVLMENNPVIRKVWNEWVEKDKELSTMTKKERLDYCKNFQWVYPKETKRMVELESLYSSVHHTRNREEFHRWFYVVCSYMLSRVHLGDNSYYWYKNQFKKQFRREKCTSIDFPKQVLLVLAMMGYITKLGGWYIFNQGSDKNRGYHFIIDKEKLVYWDNLEDKDWVMSHTEGISFQEDGSDPDRTSWTLHPDWLSERQYQSICSAQVVEEGIRETSEWLFSFDDYKYFYNLSDQEQEDLMKNWMSYQKLRDLSLGKVGGCLDDSVRTDGKKEYAGRFYSPMTNLEGKHRHKYIRLDGELVTEVDISSAQPTFLGILMYQKYGLKTTWLKKCLEGQFYEWIQEETNTQEDRDTIKKWMMQYMYSCYQPGKDKDYDKPHRPTYENLETEDPFLCFQQRLNKFLKKEEPAIYKVVDWFKRNPEYREDKPLFRSYLDNKGEKRKKKVGEGRWCSMLSYYLVKMEVEYIKRCIKELPEDMKFWTIHDCLAVKESDSLKVKEIMEQVSREMYGEDITLRLKRENTTKDYS